ncbi:MAG: hypothetical protein GQ529_00160 [Methyloprofundus sp.]|nr:hypothetical protein [Methyloprofundus sp.]
MKKISLPYWLPLLIFLIVNSQYTFAGMSINKAVIDFSVNTPKLTDLLVSNTGDEILYAKVEIFEIVNPGMKNEQRILQKPPENMDIIVTPNRVAVPVGSKKMLRFMNLKSAETKERIYRVHIAPVAGEFIAEQSGVKVLFAYDVLVIGRPIQPIANLTINRVGKHLTIHNSGNTNILLYNGKQCQQEQQPCHDLPVKRMYAGASWELDLPLDKALNYIQLGFDNKSKRLHIP